MAEDFDGGATLRGMCRGPSACVCMSSEGLFAPIGGRIRPTNVKCEFFIGFVRALRLTIAAKVGVAHVVEEAKEKTQYTKIESI